MAITLLMTAGLVRAQETQIEIHMDQTLHPLSPYLTGACLEDVNHEVYGGIYSQMIFGESFQEPPSAGNGSLQVSGMWRAIHRGTAEGDFLLDEQGAFVGQQSQQIDFKSGAGEVGIENEGLNRWGLGFASGRAYEGHLWARAAQPVKLFVALESRDGSRTYAEAPLSVTGAGWQRLDFRLKPAAADSHGRFVIKLKEPGSVTVGYAFLQPGKWGRFKGQPVRRDVAEGLQNQGITILRYGGSMVNAPAYRWKQMTGPRDTRPPYHGLWYPYSSNGWGIFDFLNFCEAAGFAAIPAVNVNETPQDMADFIEYANGPADSEWGRKRSADGHPKPYHLKYLELGNEERVDNSYWKKFQPLAEAIWAKDPAIILVVGDFAYHHPITDPFHFTGCDSGITSLVAQQKILHLARDHGREVWFDLHVGTDGPRPDSSLDGMFTYVDALSKIADGAKFRVAVFELNAGNHSQRRALANAIALNAIERDGRLLVTTSANCLQPDGQNDNGWDQGLLFLNPSQCWLQPPGYVTRMEARNFEPFEVSCQVSGDTHDLDATAARSANGKVLVLQVVNTGDQPQPAVIQVDGHLPAHSTATIEELAGPLNAVNTAQDPDHIKPSTKQWPPEFKHGRTTYQFPPHSFTVIRFD